MFEMARNNESMITAVFRDRVKAQKVYDWLLDHGYTSSELNVLMSDKTRSTYYQAEEGEEAPMKAGNQAVEGMAVGGAIGTAVGAGLAAVAAIGTSLAIPGLGIIIAGPIAAALAGGGAGAVAGGLIGGLVGLGLTESNARAYEQALKEGGVVIGVVPHSSEDADRIKTHFQNQGGENVCSC
jgi:hypothetical protein